MKVLFFPIAFLLGLSYFFSPLHAQFLPANALQVASSPQYAEKDLDLNIHEQSFVSYRIVPSYAVKEKYAGNNSTKITSKSKLNKEFTRVLLQGENPALSEINFSNEMVLAISEKGLPIGSVLTPVSVTEQGGKNLLLVYEVTRTNASGVYNPLFLLAIDKKYKNYKLHISRRMR